MKTVIELNNIEKRYIVGDHDVYALRDVTLSIDEGDYVAIMGPSGSGKSTLMHLIGLLDTPTKGSYLLNGNEVSRLSDDELSMVRRREIGFIFQQFNLLPRVSAAENVSLPLLYREGKIDLKRAEPLLEKVGLANRATHTPKALSGGQQQRVAIARALVNNPSLLLADEPTGNLDSKSEHEVMEILEKLNEQGITVVIVTHEEEIGARAKRVIRMRDGAVVSDERRANASKAVIRAPAPLEPDGESAWWTLGGTTAYIRQGLRSLMASKVRAALSILGILIGVAAVVAMLALGRGAQRAVEEQLASLGTNLLVLRPGAVRSGGVAMQSGGTTRLTEEDANAIASKITGVRSADPSVMGRVQITFEGKNWNSVVQGVTPSYPRAHSSEPTRGRFFTYDEMSRRERVALVGTTIVREVFGGQNPIGSTLKVNRISFQVVGVLPEKGANTFRDQDDVVLVPVTTAMHRLLGKEYADLIEIEVFDQAEMPRIQNEAEDLMIARHRVPPSQQQEAFQIRNMADIQEALSQSSRTMSALLAAIAAISLLVGGIGIMNIMLVSVTERTREIGLRKAIGARPKDILVQFLSESVVLSFVGGVTGVMTGWLITVSLSAIAGWSTSITADAVGLALFFSAVVGIAFGIYPAHKASRLNPIEALRFE